MSEISGVETKGANVWAVGTRRDGDDELASYTLLDGPGIAGVIDPVYRVPAYDGLGDGGWYDDDVPQFRHPDFED